MLAPPVQVLVLGRDYPLAIAGDRLFVWRDGLLLRGRWALIVAAAALSAAALRVALARKPGGTRCTGPLRNLWPLALLPLVAVVRLLADLVPAAVATNVAFYLPAAVAAAIAASFWRSSGPGAPSRTPEWVWNAAVTLAAAALYWVLGCHLAAIAGEHVGDEGHYLIQAESLSRDGDLDIRNQILGSGPGARTSLGPDELTRNHVALHSRGGHWYSWHPYGLPLLLAPAWRSGITVRYLVLALIGAAGCLAAFRLSRRVGAGRAAAGVATAGLGASFYWAVLSARALPEVLGATLLAWLFWAVRAQADRPWTATWVAAACCAYLPPTHVRFLPLSLVGMGFFGLVGLCGRQAWRARIVRLTIFSLLCGSGYAGYLAFQRHLFGGSAFVYGTTPVSQTLFSFPLGMWATIADVQGLAPIFPLIMWLIGALLAWIVVARRERFLAVCLLLTFATCVATACSNRAGVGGSCVSGRYLLAVVPLLIPAAAAMLERSSSWGRAWFVFLALASTLLLALTVLHLDDVGRGFVLPVPALRKVPSWSGLFQPHSTFLEPTLHPLARSWATLYVAAGIGVSLVLMLVPTLTRRWAAIAVVSVAALGALSHGLQAEYDPPAARPKDVARLLRKRDPDRVLAVRAPGAGPSFARPSAEGRSAVTFESAPDRPRDDWRYVDPADVATAADSEGRDCREVLTDGIIDSRWVGFAAAEDPPALTFTFRRPVPLCGLRFVSPDDRYPRKVTVDVEPIEGGGWGLALQPTRLPGFFWSGPKLVPSGAQFFKEVRFPGGAVTAARVRVTLLMGGNPHPVSLGEVLFLEQAPAPREPIPSFESCLGAIRAANVRRLYGPRWVSDRLAAAAGRGEGVCVPAVAPGSAAEWAAYDPMRPCPVVLREAAGFLLDARDAPRTRWALGGLGLACDEIPAGRYLLLVVGRPPAGSDAAQFPALYWTELGCFAARTDRFAGRKAWRGCEEARRLLASGDPAGAVLRLEEAVELSPDCAVARRALGDALRAAGRGDEAPLAEEQAVAAAAPPVPAAVRFEGGFELLGLALSALRAAPGDWIDVDCYWRYPPLAAEARPTVFVHVVQGGVLVWRDSWLLLDELLPGDLADQPFSEVFRERRSLKIPESVEPGACEIRLGLQAPDTGKRIRLETDLPVDGREVRLPVSIAVGSP